MDIAQALVSLRPGAEWFCEGNVYEGLEWRDKNQTQPTKQEVDAEIARLQQVAESNAYKQQRAAEYPPITDYLDGVVKGDQAQIDAYIAACQAVKAKYPKP